MTRPEGTPARDARFVDRIVTPTCASAPRVLTLSGRKELRALHEVQSEANVVSELAAEAVVGHGARGVRELTADVVAALRAGTHHAVTLSLTTPLGAEADARAGLAGLVAVLARRAPDATILAVLSNDGDSARWHVHALVLGSRERTKEKFVVWWTHLQPRAVRPKRVAQKASVVNVRDFWRVLTHHLVERAEEADRVTLAGPLAGRWARVLGLDAGQGAVSSTNASKSPSRATDLSTESLHAGETSDFLRPKGSCPWCAKPIEKGARSDCQKHCGCAQQTSRALVALAKKLGSEARSLAERLIRERWSVVDAVHAVRLAVARHENAGLLGIDPIPKPKRPRRCSCGKPFARNLKAKGCGEPGCRSRRHRKTHGRTDSPRWEHRTSEEKRMDRHRHFFSALLRACRWTPFSKDEARAIGAAFRVAAHEVDEVLGALVEDGNAFVLIGMSDTYGFVPPFTRMAA